MADPIEITIDDDTGHLLESLKEDYPALDAAELFKLGLVELYRKRELEQRKRWADSLPTLEISEEEAASIAEARREQGTVMTLEELKAATRK